jgi:hypothetical protein
MSQSNKNTCCGCGNPDYDENGKIIHISCDNCRLVGKSHDKKDCQRGYNNYCSEFVWCDTHEPDYVDVCDSGAEMEDEECFCMVCAYAVDIRKEITKELSMPSDIVSLIVKYSTKSDY